MASTVETLFGPGAGKPPDEVVLTGDDAQAARSARTVKTLEGMMDRGEDPRIIYPQKEGFIGKEDVFSYEAEKEMSPRVREFVRRYYGPAEMQIPQDADAGTITKLWTRVFGDSPTDAEKEQIARAQTLHARGSEFPADAAVRVSGELQKGRPTVEDRVGAIPDDTLPWLKKFASQRKRTELPSSQAQVLVEDYGLQQPKDSDKETIARARDASVFANQLERITPGLAQNTVAPILAADFNVKLNAQGLDKIDPEDLDIKQTNFQGDKLLTFIHPVTKKRTLLDPSKLEWTDFAEVLPEAMVIGGDIAGMVAGAKIGSSVPVVGTFIGGVSGGVLGAFAGRMISQQEALRRNGFAYDDTLGGWAKEGFEDEKGTPKVITPMDLIFGGKGVPGSGGAVDDALWSAGGNLAVRTAYKLAKSILTRGAPALKGRLSEEQFVKAVEDYRTSELGMELAAKGEPGTVSMVLERQADELMRQSRATTDPREAAALAREAQQFTQQAKVLRTLEQNTPAEGDREVAREMLLKKLTDEADVSSTTKVVETNPREIAEAVQKGFPETSAVKEIDTAIDDILTTNDRLANEFVEITQSGTARSADELGAALSAKAAQIIGTPQGNTGIYGVYNAIESALNKRGQKGVPLKPFDIAPVMAKLDKLQKSSGAFGGAIGKAIGEWNKAIGRTGTQVNYKNVKELLISLRSEIGSKNLNKSQIQNIDTIIKDLEKVQLQGLEQVDNILGTSYAAKQASADANLANIGKIWQRGFTQALEEGNFATVVPALFTNKSAGFVAEAMRTLKPGKEQKELLKNALLFNYKQALRRAATGESETGVDVAGKKISIGLENRGVTVTQANEAVHQRFLDENQAWIDTLFQKGEFDRLTDITRSSRQLARDAKNLQTFDETLRKNPIFANSDRIINTNQNLGQVIVDSPNLLFDEILNQAPGFRERGMRALLGAIRTLPKEERAIANESLRALSVRRIFNPDEAGVAASRDAPPLTAFDNVEGALAEIKTNEALYNVIFGQSHRKNMEKILKDMEVIVRKSQPAVMEETGMRGAKSIPLRALKVYVGVLNRRARTLTQTKEALGEDLEVRMLNSLRNPEKAARLVALSKTNVNTKFGLNALGQILGLNQVETKDAMDAFANIPLESIAGEVIP